jgi:hypothetical protein
LVKVHVQLEVKRAEARPVLNLKVELEADPEAQLEPKSTGFGVATRSMHPQFRESKTREGKGGMPQALSRRPRESEDPYAEVPR